MKFCSLSALLFPPRCAACGKRLHWYCALTDFTYALCGDCEKDWQSAALETCSACARPVTQCDCLTVEMKRARVGAYRKLVYYERARPHAAQNRVIYTIKNKPSRRVDAWLADLLCQPLDALLSGSARENAVLAYVPRSLHAKHESGTDQAEDLARALARASGISCLRLLCRTRKNKLVQKTLSSEARRENAVEAYRIRRGREKDIRGRTVVLIDDIVTTGSSMAACTRLLRAAGAARVLCLSVASDDYNAELTPAKTEKKTKIL